MNARRAIVARGAMSTIPPRRNARLSTAKNPPPFRASRDAVIQRMQDEGRYLGATTVEHLSVEYQEFGDARHEASKRAAFDALPALIERLQATGRNGRKSA